MIKNYTEEDIFEIRALLEIIINQMQIIAFCEIKQVQDVSFQTETVADILLRKFPLHE